MTDRTVIGRLAWLVATESSVVDVVSVDENRDLTRRIVVSGVRKLETATNEERDECHRGGNATPARTRAGTGGRSLWVRSPGRVSRPSADAHRHLVSTRLFVHLDACGIAAVPAHGSGSTILRHGTTGVQVLLRT